MFSSRRDDGSGRVGEREVLAVAEPAAGKEDGQVRRHVSVGVAEV